MLAPTNELSEQSRPRSLSESTSTTAWLEEDDKGCLNADASSDGPPQVSIWSRLHGIGDAGDALILLRA